MPIMDGAGAATQEYRGLWEVGFPQRWEPGEIGKLFLQHCIAFCNRKSTKRQEPLRTGGNQE